jgi:HEAT repeat protein
MERRRAALAGLKANESEFAAALCADLASTNRFVRRNAAKELKTVEASDSDLRRAMIRGLGDEDQYVRQWLSEGLGKSRVSEAVPELERLARQDSSSDARNAAAAAVEMIRWN